MEEEYLKAISSIMLQITINKLHIQKLTEILKRNNLISQEEIDKIPEEISKMDMQQYMTSMFGE